MIYQAFVVQCDTEACGASVVMQGPKNAAVAAEAAVEMGWIVEPRAYCPTCAALLAIDMLPAETEIPF
jgi:hypothetical protein